MSRPSLGTIHPPVQWAVWVPSCGTAGEVWIRPVMSIYCRV